MYFSGPHWVNSVCQVGCDIYRFRSNWNTGFLFFCIQEFQFLVYPVVDSSILSFLALWIVSAYFSADLVGG